MKTIASVLDEIPLELTDCHNFCLKFISEWQIFFSNSWVLSPKKGYSPDSLNIDINTGSR